MSVGIPFVTEKEKDVELTIAIIGANIRQNASFKPPISLSQPRIVALLRTCRNFLLDRVISILKS